MAPSFSGRISQIASGILAASGAWITSGIAAKTNPAPLRKAAWIANPAAPVYLREPAITSALPKVPLKESSGRTGISERANSVVIGVAEKFFIRLIVPVESLDLALCCFFPTPQIAMNAYH